jgi:hypothetical protein
MIITFAILKEQTFTNVPWIYKASDCVNTAIKHDCYMRSFYFVTLCINTIIYYLINIYICDIICKYQLYLHYEANYLENSQIEILVSQFKAHVVSSVLRSRHCFMQELSSICRCVALYFCIQDFPPPDYCKGWERYVSNYYKRKLRSYCCPYLFNNLFVKALFSQ